VSVGASGVVSVTDGVALVVVSVVASVVHSVNDPVFHHPGPPFQDNVVDAGPVVLYLCMCVPMFIKHLKW